MKTRKTTGLALATCLVFTTAACQAEAKDNAVSKGPGVTVNGNSDQSVIVTDGASSRADGKDSEQNIGSNNGSSGSKDSKGGSSMNVTSAGGTSVEGGAAVDDDDWKEAATDKDAVAVTIAGGSAVISSSGGTVHVRESVDQITVIGSDVRAVAKVTKKIPTQGSSIKVFVKQTSSVGFNGSDNEVGWANGSKPTVNDNGSDNKVEKAG